MATNPHIYVSSVHGTNTGASDTSYASQQTGNITSLTAGNVYTSIDAMVSGCSPSSGDTIYIADNHAASIAPSANYIIDGGTTGAGIIIVSVDNTAINTKKAGASEIYTNGSELTVNGFGYVYGLTYGNTDYGIDTSTPASHFIFEECTFVSSNSGQSSIVRMDQDGVNFRLINTDLNFDHACEAFNINSGGRLFWEGGAITGTTSPSLFFNNYFTNGGAKIEIKGVDLSKLTTSFINSLTANASDDVQIKLQNCLISSSVTLPVALTDLSSNNLRFEMFNCDDSTGDDLTRFYIATGSGSARNNASVYNSNNPAFFEGSNKSSIEVRTTTLCGNPSPLYFEISTQYIDLSSASTDKVTVNLVSNFAMTDADICAYMTYPDGTTAVQPNTVNSGKTVLGTGTTLSTSALGASDWTGEPTSPNFYKLELDTSTDAGQAFAVSVRIEVYKASIDGTTNKLYIDPILEVGT